MIGKVVNYRYEILEKAGDGSLYSVYKARDKVLNRLVATKILHNNFASNKDFANRLTAEVQNVQDLAHPNIARVYEADQQEGVYFTAVEFVRGINLKDRIRRTAPFTISYAVDIAIAVCEALDYAHKTGVVHGDIRPHNILTSPEGQVKLTDFGVGAAVSAFPHLRDNNLLRSVHYAAPEVLKGRNPQPASDLYSLGAVLFEMVTGSVPFDADTSMAIAAKHLEEPPPLTHEVNPAVPKALSAVIARAMAKDPAERYSSAADMMAELHQVRELLRTGQVPPASKAASQKTIVGKAAEPDYHDEKPEQDLRHTLLVLLGVFVLAVVLTGGLMYAYTHTAKPQVQVPDFVGKRVEEAELIARQAGVTLVDYREEFNDRYDQGEVYMTDPAPGGMVPRDDPKVKIWVSKGPRLAEIPDLVGFTQDDATRRIGQAGFVIGKISSEYSDNTEAGRVIRQKPNPGENREPLSPVDLVVSQGPRPEPPPPTDTSESTVDQPKQFDIKINVPNEVPDPTVVKVLVSDSEGTDRVAYEEPRHPGESFTQQIVGYGDSIEIRVFVGDNELFRREY